MKIIINASDINSDGGIVLLNDLLEVALQRRDFDFFVFADSSYDKRSYSADNIHFIDVSIPQRIFVDKKIQKLVKNTDVVLNINGLPPLKKQVCQVVQYHQNRYFIDDYSTRGLPLIVRMRLAVEKLAFKIYHKNADQLIVQNLVMKDLLLKKGIKDDIISDLLFKNIEMLIESDVKKERNSFIYVASDEPHKNHKNLILAWKILKNEGINPKLYISNHPEEGYRRLCYMMIDDNVVATSPTTVYRVLLAGGCLKGRKEGPSLKGTGFRQPTQPHEHRHIDVSYINICGTFYYLCSILDGYSRVILHHEIREKMKEADIEIVLQRALERYPGYKTRIISDNGPQFIARDFKDFIRENSLKHVRTSPYYPQSNGKKERYFRTLKSSCIRKKTPLSLEDARRIVEGFVLYYNEVRLHSAIGYITPRDMLAERAEDVFALRIRRLTQARDVRVAVHAFEREKRLEEAA